MMETIQKTLQTQTIPNFNSLDLFYSDEWSDLPIIEVKHVNIDNINTFEIIFIVNGIEALNICMGQAHYYLDKKYSGFVYEWIVTYLHENFNLSKDTIATVITHSR